jgi:L-fuculose-phosphate aldolase
MTLDDAVADIATYSAKVVDSGLLHMQGGNLSVRLGDNLVITRTRTLKLVLGPDDVVVAPIDDDAPVDGASSTLAMHRAIYRKTGAGAIMHAHPYHATLLSFFQDSFEPVEENGLLYLGRRIRCVAAPGYLRWNEVAEEMADALTESPAAMLKWHGSFTTGASMALAFHNTQAIESTARFILDLRRLGGTLGQPTLADYVPGRV